MSPARATAVALVALSIGSIASIGAAQAPPPSVLVARAIDSGPVANRSAREARVVAIVVEEPGAPWLRVRFAALELAPGARLAIVSAADGAEQRLDARAFAEWSATSAYFNGDALSIEVWSPPLAGPSRVAIEAVEVGVVPPNALFQCGATDDRVPSSDPRCARTMPGGCSAFLVQRCGHGLLSAGHCAPYNQVVEFDVPPSTSAGVVQHPPPEKQFAIDASSVQGSAVGVGDDWTFFGCFANASTGLTAFETQHAAFDLATVAPAAPPIGPPQTLRITGYGYDVVPVERYVQQSSAGTALAHVGTTLEYLVDTEPGDSGAPIVWEEAGVVIGIHTHGNCDAAGTLGNLGTAIDAPGLQAALASPLGACVCAPEASRYCVAKTNSRGCVPRITWTGAPSASGGAGSFTIGAELVINNRNGFLVYGLAAQELPFQGGTLCVDSFRRTPVQGSGGNPPPADCSGHYAYDMGARIAGGLDQALVVGATVHAQWYSRDGASQPWPIGLTDALQFTIGP